MNDHPLRCRCGRLRGWVSRPEKVNRGVCYCRDCQALACMSLTERGMLRWYASCCNTPIGNTQRDFRLPFVGLVHTRLEDPSRTLDSVFGPVRMRLNTRHAKGRVKTMPVSMAKSKSKSMFRFMGSVLRARLDGSYKRSPFFAPDRGTPVAIPKVPSAGELALVMKAV